MSVKITLTFSRIKEPIRIFIHQLRMEASGHHHTEDYSELYRRVPFKIQFFYGIGHVLNDVCASMWFTYLLVFFHFVLEVDNGKTGLLLLIGQIADAVATPFVGYHSDNSDDACSRRYGRRKVWHLLGTICVAGSFPFIFAPCVGCNSTNDWGQIFYYSMFIIIFQFGWASVQISHLSLIPELTPNEHDRTKLTAVRYSFTVISNVLVYIITWTVLHLNNGESSKIQPGDEYKFQYVVWIVLSFGGVCSVLFHLFVKELNSDVTYIQSGHLRTSVPDLFRNVTIYQVAVVYMSSRLFVNLTQVFIPLYLHETLDMSASSLALIPLIMFVGSFITSLPLERINRYFGRRITYLIGFLLGFVACIWIHFGEGNIYTSYCMYIIAALIGSCGSIVLVTSLGVTTDFIGDKTGSGAFIYGIMSFTDKLANGVAVIIVQNLHQYNTNIYFYRDILSYVCGGSLLLGTLVILSIIPRNRGDRLLDYQEVSNYNTIN